MVTFLKKVYRYFWRKIYWLLFRTVFRKPFIFSDEQTLRYIIKNKVSIARFGDGEFSMMLGSKEHIGFQTYNTQLSTDLQDVIVTRNRNLLICIPDYFRDKNVKNDYGKWLKQYIFDNYKNIRPFIDFKYHYGEAKISRFYHPSVNYPIKKIDYLTKIYIPLLKQLWEKRHVIFVEGENTKLGVGNDLFDNCLDIRRILCPDKNAYDKKDEIYKSIIKVAKHDDLVILALGPTATILSKELTLKNKLQCLDIGHVDIIYLWFLHKVKNKAKISGKQVNEAWASQDTIDIVFNHDDYEKTIIDKIS